MSGRLSLSFLQSVIIDSSLSWFTRFSIVAKFIGIAIFLYFKHIFGCECADGDTFYPILMLSRHYK